MQHYFFTLINGEGPLCTIQRLKLKFDKLLSNFAFNANLRRYTTAAFMQYYRDPLSVG